MDMSRFVSVLLYPLLLLVSVSLMGFAVFTTAAALSTLLFRVLLVYADLAAVLIKTQLLHHGPLTTTSHRPTKSSRTSASLSRRRSSSSTESQPFGGSRTPKSSESSGLGIYSAGTMQRDFEGVGGWRIPNTEGEDILWTSMNARLELPAFSEGQYRHHRRAITSGGASAAARVGLSEQQVGRVSPNGRPLTATDREEYFYSRQASKSTTALGATKNSRHIH
ncbi:MAG: hypothetical protein Q9224_000745 [Gallowayella concinna]